MNYKEYEIGRDELYKKVWSKPMIQIADEYGVSDKAIAKICDKLTVPVPGIGYWRKIEVGEELPKQKLPDVPPNFPTFHIIRKREPEYELEITDEVKLLIDKESDPVNKIVVSQKRGATHLLLKKTEYSLHLSHRTNKFLVNSNEVGVFKISVSPLESKRAFRILDTIIKELENRGYLIYISNELLCVKIFGVELSFSLKEKSKRIELKKESPYDYKNYDFVPTGILTLTIEEFYCDHSLRRNFSDIKSLTLEERLNELIIALLIASQAYIAKEKHLALRRALWAEEERREKEILEVKEKEKKKLRKLKGDVKNWHYSKLIRDYIEELKKKLIDDSLTKDQRKEISEYIEWALKRADKLDPFVE